MEEVAEGIAAQRFSGIDWVLIHGIQTAAVGDASTLPAYSLTRIVLAAFNKVMKNPLTASMAYPAAFLSFLSGHGGPAVEDGVSAVGGEVDAADASVVGSNQPDGPVPFPAPSVAENVVPVHVPAAHLYPPSEDVPMAPVADAENDAPGHVPAAHLYPPMHPELDDGGFAFMHHELGGGGFALMHHELGGGGGFAATAEHHANADGGPAAGGLEGSPATVVGQLAGSLQGVGLEAQSEGQSAAAVLVERVRQSLRDVQSVIQIRLSPLGDGAKGALKICAQLRGVELTTSGKIFGQAGMCVVGSIPARRRYNVNDLLDKAIATHAFRGALSRLAFPQRRPDSAGMAHATMCARFPGLDGRVRWTRSSTDQCVKAVDAILAPGSSGVEAAERHLAMAGGMEQELGTWVSGVREGAGGGGGASDDEASESLEQSLQSLEQMEDDSD